MDDLQLPNSYVTMPDSFGARVRRHREERLISLRTIADQTKIKMSLLEGLERDDMGGWPAGIYRRAYVRAYALAIGLDPDTIVREFLQAHPEPTEIIETAPAPPPRFRGLVGSAMGSWSRLRRSPAPPPPVREPLSPPEFGRRSEVTAQPQGTAGYVPLEVDPPFVETPAPPPLPVAAAPPPPEPEPEPPVQAQEAVTMDERIELPVEIDWLAAAQLCTELGRVDDGSQIQPLLQDAARILDANVLIVWVWDDVAGELRPALVHGFSEKVLAQLPPVRRDDDNITASAFRSGRTCAINGSDGASDALVVPLLAPSGAAGALALELPHGTAQRPGVRAVATFFAAMLAQLVGGAAPAAANAPSTTATARQHSA